MHRVLLISMLAIVPGLTVAATDATPVEAAWAALHKALDGNEDRKRQALAALGSVDPANELAVKLLVDALQDKDPLVRQTAATALGEMKAKQGRVGRFQHDDSVVAFCGDDNYMVRRITNAWERWLSWSLPTKIGIIGTVASVLSVALYIWDLKPFLEHRFEKPAQKGE